MKAFLLYSDRDLDFDRPLPWSAPSLTADLALPTVFSAMSDGDKFVYEACKKVMFAGSADPSVIAYRQAILMDCLRNRETIADLYAMLVDSDEGYRRHYWIGRSPSSTLWGSVGLLEYFLEALKRLRTFADRYARAFESQGLQTLFAMLQRELSDDYFLLMQRHLKQLKFKGGVVISAHLGAGNQGTGYVLRRSTRPEKTWLERVFSQGPAEYSFELHPRDEAGARALATLRDRGVNLVGNAAAQSSDHVVSFFKLLRAEVAFYIGCLNLHERLAARGLPTTFPVPLPVAERSHVFRGLYDVSLALTLDAPIVGNDLSAPRSDVTIVTGANRGGKTVFLRSIGLAQMMMQCGMFVAAESFSANVCSGVFTHYRREEDRSMESGKFDEEIGRLSEIADHIRPDALVLFNESFAATNDREGSEIARQIVSALLERRIKVFFVTHLYDFARSLWENNVGTPTFLRAERQADGSRTFKLTVARPLETSYGEDLYRHVFEASAVDRSA